MHKVITFGIPSYNAAKDMDHCITSILEGSNYATDIEIIVVDDGSKDDTAAIADQIVEKQLRMVHEIASLLGETAAETKIAISDLKESVIMEDNND